MWRNDNNWIGILVNYKLRSNHKNHWAYIQVGVWSWYKGRGIRNWSLA